MKKEKLSDRESDAIAMTFVLIEAEIRRAKKLHPSMNSLHEAYAVIVQNLDEFWELVKIVPEKLTAKQRKRRGEALLDELIRIAATCVRTLTQQ